MRGDYFIVSGAQMPFVQDSLIHNQYEGSDHCPIQLIIDQTKKGDDSYEDGSVEEQAVKIQAEPVLSNVNPATIPPHQIETKQTIKEVSFECSDQKS